MMGSSLPLPTPEQCEQFAHHVCGAHSWYKHIPLFDGAEFIFFLSQDAGRGYSDEDPRLHYSWETTQEYHRRFGYLDYLYRLPDESAFSRDGRIGAAAVSQDVLSLGRTVLYPFVSDDYNAQEVLLYLISERFWERLQTAQSHPHRQEILRWYMAYVEQDDAFDDLSKTEQDVALSVDLLESTLNEEDLARKLALLPPPVAKYLRSEMEATNLYLSLQAGELCKVRSALDQLQSVLENGGNIWF